MGAIVGGLYAAGYSPDEMMALIASQAFGYMAQGKVDRRQLLLLADAHNAATFQPASAPKQSVESSVYNPQSIIGPEPMAFGFMEIFGPATAHCRGDFDRLFLAIPQRGFRHDAPPPTSSHQATFGTAVRASMSFPLIFQAIEIDSAVYYDGGIFDNFPRRRNARRLPPRPSPSASMSSSPDKGRPTTFLDQLDQLVRPPSKLHRTRKRRHKDTYRRHRIRPARFSSRERPSTKPDTTEPSDARQHTRPCHRRRCADVELAAKKNSAVTHTRHDIHRRRCHRRRNTEQNRYIRAISSGPTTKTRHTHRRPCRLAYCRAIATGRLDAIS